MLDGAVSARGCSLRRLREQASSRSPGGGQEKQEERKEKGVEEKRDEFFIKKAASVNARLKMKEKTEGGEKNIP